MKVFTFYNHIPDLWTEESQRSLIKVWERSWRRSGWEPVVLDEKFLAARHPRYDFFKEHFWRLPSPYGNEYTGACFLRWLAMAAVGGGMLVDYDVINYDFRPQEPDTTQIKIFCDPPPTGFWMGAVLGCAQHYLDMCEIFAAWVPSEADFDERLGARNCEDQSLLIRMFDRQNYPKPEWLTRIPGCSHFDTPGGKTSPLVHYPYSMRAAGFWPKDEWIEKLRPF